MTSLLPLSSTRHQRRSGSFSVWLMAISFLVTSSQAPRRTVSVAKSCPEFDDFFFKATFDSELTTVVSILRT
ncbi:hypothetical protein BJ165DRAFT_1479165 [Panaeolus papilionaceus]|nr:hypothetical protein BJ165DRAFT_1479165 [Panaeolus papilionaceus]